jgi:Ecdysteroid kinase-like family
LSLVEFFFVERLIYQALEPHPVIILEDLRIKGFEIMGDAPPKTIEESIKIFRKLSKFHAASFYLNSEKVAFST